jgi:hypothetical protein
VLEDHDDGPAGIERPCIGRAGDERDDGGGLAEPSLVPVPDAPPRRAPLDPSRDGTEAVIQLERLLVALAQGSRRRSAKRDLPVGAGLALGKDGE